jgi:hypothetical protein
MLGPGGLPRPPPGVLLQTSSALRCIRVDPLVAAGVIWQTAGQRSRLYVRIASGQKSASTTADRASVSVTESARPACR